MTDHGRWGDAAGSYLLGALPDGEREGYEAHLATCGECREEIDDLAPAAHALPASVHPIAPPPALKSRIMVEVQREASLLAAAGPEADRVSEPAAAPRRRRWGLGWALQIPRLGPVATAMVLLLVGAAVGVGATRFSAEGARTVVASVDEGRAPNTSAELTLDGGSATLVAHNLSAPPSGRVYQVWTKRPGQDPQPTSVLFTPNREGEATASVPGPLDGVGQVMVTDEPSTGSTAPTKAPLFVADLS